MGPVILNGGDRVEDIEGQSINIFHSRKSDQNVVGKREAIKTVS